MAESEQPETPLAERIVKEAVTKGMDSPMRETIVEAVDEAEGERASKRKIPLVGALLGVGAAFGYLLGVRSKEMIDSEDVSLESVEEPDVIDDLTGETEESVTDQVEETVGTETDETDDEAASGSRLARIVLGLGAIAAVVLARRRLSGGEEEEWEPIEEFDSDDEQEGETEEEEEAESEDETDEESADEEEAEAESEDEE